MRWPPRACTPPARSSWSSSCWPTSADADGKVQPARDVLDGRATRKTEVYSVDHLHGMLPLFTDIYAGAEGAGIKAETLISEYAPGQYELTLHYRDRCDAGGR